MKASELPNASATIENCADEPIHVPGAIQPYGVLLVLEEKEFTVVQVSDNISSLLKIDAEQVLGQPLSLIIGEEQQDYIIQEARQGDLSPKNPFLKTPPLHPST